MNPARVGLDDGVQPSGKRLGLLLGRGQDKGAGPSLRAQVEHGHLEGIGGRVADIANDEPLLVDPGPHVPGLADGRRHGQRLKAVDLPWLSRPQHDGRTVDGGVDQDEALLAVEKQ